MGNIKIKKFFQSLTSSKLTIMNIFLATVSLLIVLFSQLFEGLFGIIPLIFFYCFLFSFFVSIAAIRYGIMEIITNGKKLKYILIITFNIIYLICFPVITTLLAASQVGV